MTRAEELIRQEIDRTGPLSFSKFIDIALYHPLYGYYNRRAPQRGRSGDYFTSLQVSSLFPSIFASVFGSMKEALGSEQFALIEIGSGDGEFLEGVLTELASRKQLRGFKTWAVERSRSARDRLTKRLSRFDKCSVVESVDQIEWMGTLEGCIFSNEFFDALPFDRYQVSNGQWTELTVGCDGLRLTEQQRDVKAEVQQQLPSINEWNLASGHSIEYRPSVDRIYEEWGALLSRGYIFTVDYGHPRAVLMDPSRSLGTVMAYHKHQASTNVLNHLGEQDLTAHVDFTQLVEAGLRHGWQADFYCSQGVFLSTVGQSVIAEFLASASEGERPNRAAALRQLVHPSSMGEKFWTLLQSKDAPIPTPLSQLPNRLRRLL